MTTPQKRFLNNALFENEILKIDSFINQLYEPSDSQMSIWTLFNDMNKVAEFLDFQALRTWVKRNSKDPQFVKLKRKAATPC